jgi:hypothetical protein
MNKFILYGGVVAVVFIVVIIIVLLVGGFSEVAAVVTVATDDDHDYYTIANNRGYNGRYTRAGSVEANIQFNGYPIYELRIPNTNLSTHYIVYDTAVDNAYSRNIVGADAYQAIIASGNVSPKIATLITVPNMIWDYKSASSGPDIWTYVE